MEFLLGRTLEMSDVVSISGKYNYDQYQNVINELNDRYKEHKRVNNFIITTTKSIEVVNGEQVLDVEVLLPVNRSNISVDYPYVFKEKIVITNAIYTRVENVALLQNVLNDLNQYIANNSLQPITSAYLVQQKQGQEHHIEIYLGINPNIL